MNAQKPTTKKTDIVAVGTNHEGLAGAIICWFLSGGIDPEKLSTAWIAAGLDPRHLPSLPSPETALARAVKEVASRTPRSGHRILARELPEGKGWTLKHERPTEDKKDLDYTTEGRVWTDKVGRAFAEPETDITRAALAQYQRTLGELDAHDVSSWLVKMVELCNAVSIRGRGGVYFVPRTSLDLWRSIVGALRGASRHTVYEIPAMTSDEAVFAALDALAREAEAECGALMQEVQEQAGTPFSARGLKSREGQLERLRKKIESYTEMLGQSRDDLLGRVEEVKAALATGRIVSASSAPAGEGLSL